MKTFIKELTYKGCREDFLEDKISSNIAGNIINYISDDTVLSDFVLQLGDNRITCENLTGSGNISAIIEYTNNYAMAVIKW